MICLTLSSELCSLATYISITVVYNFHKTLKDVGVQLKRMPLNSNRSLSHPSEYSAAVFTCPDRTPQSLPRLFACLLFSTSNGIKIHVRLYYHEILCYSLLMSGNNHVSVHAKKTESLEDPNVSVFQRPDLDEIEESPPGTDTTRYNAYR